MIREETIAVSPDDTISKLIPLIENDRLREIIITDKGKFKGIVYSKDISNKDMPDPSKVKVGSIMRTNAPTISADQDISEAAELLFKTGLKSLPILESGKVVGIISLSDIVDFASNSKEFKQTKVDAIMCAPEVIEEEADIGKVRSLMREKNISRLPVVDSNQRLIGIVTIFDLLKALKPKERMDFYSMGAEREGTMGMSVSTIIDNSPVIVDKSKSLDAVAKLMKKSKTDGVIVVENSKPVGIVTEKDLVEVYVSSLKKKGVYYQISGLTNEDEFATATVDRMVRDTLQKMAKVINPQFFFMHVKKHEKKGKAKYSIRTRFLTDKGVFISKSYDWDIRDAVNHALENLEKMMVKEIETKRDRARHTKA
ncbi:MAG: CBS domain-containing protein [Candidatus Aenigmatarchaeota archaeon]